MMVSYRRGANKLPMRIDWQILFIPMGSVVQAARDTLFLDVGGHLCPGIIDQHQATGVGASTTELVYSHPEFVYEHLLGRWLDLHAQGQQLPERWSLNIVTHNMPDFDALCAIWLVQHLIETGDFPPIVRALVGYVSEVDQGKYKIDLSKIETATHALHIAYLAIQNLKAPAGRDHNHWCIERGISLLNIFSQSIAIARQGNTPMVSDNKILTRLNASDLYPGQPGVMEWRNHESFYDVRELLENDIQKYNEDKNAADRPIVKLPSMDGQGDIEVRAFICKEPTKSILNKYWVRADKHPYFICPYTTPVGRSKQHFPRVILSLDPTWTDPQGRKPTLKGLGFALEAEECAVRKANGKEERIQTPRWDDGSVNNADPWYDGRGHSYTIVETPTIGTDLSFSTICKIATEYFWHIPLERAQVWILSPCITSSVKASQPHPQHPQGFLPTMDPWFKDCQVIDIDPLPSDNKHDLVGFSVTKISERIFRLDKQFAYPMRIVEMSLNTPGGATLENLVKWGQEALSKNSYVFTHVQVHKRRDSIQRADILLRELCAGGSAISNGDNKNIAIFNGRVVAMHPPNHSTQYDAQSKALMEVLLYAAFQAEVLARFSQRAGDAVMAYTTGTSSNTMQIILNFLTFQSRYFHVEIVRDELVRQVYLGLRESLGLDRLHDKVSSELDRLDKIEKDRSQNQTTDLVFFVGLTGIISAFTINLDEVRAWQWEGVTILVMVVALAYYWKIKRGRDTP